MLAVQLRCSLQVCGCCRRVQNNYYSSGPSIGISPFGGFGSPFGFSPFGFGGFGFGMPVAVGGAPMGLFFQLFVLTAVVSLIGSAVRAAASRRDDRDDEW